MYERKDYASWDDTFMEFARIAAKRSKDPATQVGAIIVSKDKRRTSLGYNGAPLGFDDAIFPWGKGNENPMENKYPFVVHAERNAIDNVAGDASWLEGATIYVTHSPCHECAKGIVNKGIKKVVYEELKADVFTEHIFKVCGVEMIPFANLK